jgi:glutathione S-transferase
MDGTLQLYTFAISHFSEKARWALDFEGLVYEERLLIPGPHLWTTRRLAPRTTVPILRHGRATVQGSSAILDYLHTVLGRTRLARPASAEPPADPGLEARLDRAFGLGIQRIFYGALLDRRAVVTDLWCQHGPPWAPVFYALAYRGVAAAVRRRFKITPDAIERAKQRFRETVAETDALLEARRYLDGDAPGRTDVTLAALLAPACRPPEHRMRWPEPPPELAEFLEPFEGGPTWNHVRHMYRAHRAVE